MPKLNVLRPFVLSVANNGGTNTMPKEHRFSVGVHEVESDVFNHPYIKAGADGAIESAEQAKQRESATKARDDEQAKLNAKYSAEAEMLAKRAQGTNKVAEVRDTETEKALNTPVNQLRAQQGMDIQTPIRQGGKPLSLPQK